MQLPVLLTKRPPPPGKWLSGRRARDRRESTVAPCTVGWRRFYGVKGDRYRYSAHGMLLLGSSAGPSAITSGGVIYVR